MSDAERDLLFYVAEILAKAANPAGIVRPAIERLLRLARAKETQ